MGIDFTDDVSYEPIVTTSCQGGHGADAPPALPVGIQRSGKAKAALRSVSKRPECAVLSICYTAAVWKDDARGIIANGWAAISVSPRGLPSKSGICRTTNLAEGDILLLTRYRLN